MVFSFWFLIELCPLDAANRRSGFTVSRVRYGLHPRQAARGAQEARDEVPVSANKGSRGATNRRRSHWTSGKNASRVDFSKRLCIILRLSNERLGPVSQTGPMRFGVCAVGRKWRLRRSSGAPGRIRFAACDVF